MSRESRKEMAIERSILEPLPACQNRTGHDLGENAWGFVWHSNHYLFNSDEVRWKKDEESKRGKISKSSCGSVRV